MAEPRTLEVRFTSYGPFNGDSVNNSTAAKLAALARLRQRLPIDANAARIVLPEDPQAAPEVPVAEPDANAYVAIEHAMQFNQRTAAPSRTPDCRLYVHLGVVPGDGADEPMYLELVGMNHLSDSDLHINSPIDFPAPTNGEEPPHGTKSYRQTCFSGFLAHAHDRQKRSLDSVPDPGKDWTPVRDYINGAPNDRPCRKAELHFVPEEFTGDYYCNYMMYTSARSLASLPASVRWFDDGTPNTPNKRVMPPTAADVAVRGNFVPTLSIFVHVPDVTSAGAAETGEALARLVDYVAIRVGAEAQPRETDGAATKKNSRLTAAIRDCK